jgi:hypothetical protein
MCCATTAYAQSRPDGSIASPSIRRIFPRRLPCFVTFRRWTLPDTPGFWKNRTRYIARSPGCDRITSCEADSAVIRHGSGSRPASGTHARTVPPDGDWVSCSLRTVTECTDSVLSRCPIMTGTSS